MTLPRNAATTGTVVYRSTVRNALLILAPRQADLGPPQETGSLSGGLRDRRGRLLRREASQPRQAGRNGRPSEHEQEERGAHKYDRASRGDVGVEREI